MQLGAENRHIEFNDLQQIVQVRGLTEKQGTRERGNKGKRERGTEKQGVGSKRQENDRVQRGSIWEWGVGWCWSWLAGVWISKTKARDRLSNKRRRTVVQSDMEVGGHD